VNAQLRFASRSEAPLVPCYIWCIWKAPDVTKSQSLRPCWLTIPFAWPSSCGFQQPPSNYSHFAILSGFSVQSSLISCVIQELYLLDVLFEMKAGLSVASASSSMPRQRFIKVREAMDPAFMDSFRLVDWLDLCWVTFKLAGLSYPTTAMS
jgi:hypothetical protein